MKDRNTQIQYIIRSAYEERNTLQIDSEIVSDIRNIHMIKKMVNRFLKSKYVNDRLLVNNIVITLNTVGIFRANRVFELVLNKHEREVVIPILKFLSSYYPSVWAEHHIDENNNIKEVLNASISI